MCRDNISCWNPHKFFIFLFNSIHAFQYRAFKHFWYIALQEQNRARHFSYGITEPEFFRVNQAGDSVDMYFQVLPAMCRVSGKNQLNW